MNYLNKWNRIPPRPGLSFREGLIFLMDVKGFTRFPRWDFTHDLSVYTHSPKRLEFYERILTIDATLLLGEYETERKTLVTASFNNLRYVCGSDFLRDKPISLENAKLLILENLGISREEFLRLFQLPGMTETCRNGIRELLE